MATSSPTRARQTGGSLTDRQLITEGARVFASSCGNAYCHGTGGRGGGAPALRGKGLSPDYVFKSISNGIPGSAMPSFKSEFSEEQIWKLVAFILSDGATSPAKAEPPAAVEPAPSQLVRSKPQEVSPATAGDAQAGKALFFDSSSKKSCHLCHRFNGEGASVGPDLSRAGRKSARELFLSIVSPRAGDATFAMVSVTLTSGEKITGIRKDEDAESIRIYDTTELPAVLRTIQKPDIFTLEPAKEPVMPEDYASTLTLKQVLDLIAFLRSAVSKDPVTLNDLFH